MSTRWKTGNRLCDLGDSTASKCKCGEVLSQDACRVPDLVDGDLDPPYRASWYPHEGGMLLVCTQPEVNTHLRAANIGGEYLREPLYTMTDIKKHATSANLSTSDEPTVNDEDIYIDSRKERKLLWKCDMFLTSLLTLAFLSAYLDRSNIGNAAIAGLLPDLNMSRQQLASTHRLILSTKCHADLG
jgi:hypothetical protein